MTDTRATRRTTSGRAAGAATLLLLAAGLAGCAATAEAEPGTAGPGTELVERGALTVCTDMPYAPFEAMKDGEPVGFDIDLVKQVAAELDLEPTVLDTDFDAIQSGDALNSGECDIAISAMTITGDRARVLDFSSPYFNASQALVAADGSGWKALDDLSGKKVGVQGGTTGELYVTDNAPGDATVVPFEDSAALDDAIATGTVDAAVYDNTVVGDVIADNAGLEVVAEFDTGEQYGMAVMKNGNVDLLRTVNDVLARLRSDGGYDKIYAEWFGETGS